MHAFYLHEFIFILLSPVLLCNKQYNAERRWRRYCGGGWWWVREVKKEPERRWKPTAGKPIIIIFTSQHCWCFLCSLLHLLCILHLSFFTRPQSIEIGNLFLWRLEIFRKNCVWSHHFKSTPKRIFPSILNILLHQQHMCIEFYNN